MSVTLAIETSQRSAEVALRLPSGDAVDEAVGPSGCGDDLMATIDRLCRRHAVDRRSISTVAVDVGPGGFTGLRVGLATANVLAESLGASLVGVPGALVAARGSAALRRSAAPRRVLAVLAVKRAESSSSQAGTAWCALLVRSDVNGPWSMLAPTSPSCPSQRGSATQDHLVRLVDLHPESLPATLGASAVLAQEGQLPDVARRAREAGLEWIEPAWAAVACLECGEASLARGETVAPGSLLPLYGRAAEAVSLHAAGR